MFMLILAWMGIGIAAGLFARLALSNTKGQPYRLGATIAMGIAGALVGGWIGQQIFVQTIQRDYNSINLVMAFVGAVIVVAFLRLMDKERYVS